MPDLERELLQHAGALRALALRLVGARHADDLVQETSLLAWQRPPAEGTGLGGWLRAVLRHRADKLRRGETRRLQREQAKTPPDAASSPLAEVEQREAVQHLHRALMALPAPYQGVLLQRFFQDRMPSAIAAANGVPVATVKSQLQRGLGLLRERLDADGGHGDWRRAFASAFALPRPGVPVAMSAAAMLASAKWLWLGGGAVVAVLSCLALWQDPPDGPRSEHTSLSQAAIATGELPNPRPTGAPAHGERTAATATGPDSAAPPVQLRFVDAHDGTPLPHLDVGLHRDPETSSQLHSAESDAAGEITLDGSWRNRMIDVIPRIDGGSTQRQLIRAEHWVAVGERLDVAIAVGPTYTLLFDQPPPGRNLEAIVAAGSDPRFALQSQGRKVRDGSPPWIRFGFDAATPSALGDGPWQLVVTDGRGHWFAAGPVPSIRSGPWPVTLRTQVCGELLIAPTVASQPPGPAVHASVYALDTNGEPIEPGRHCTLAGRATARANVAGPPPKGPTARLEYLPVGRYRVFVRGPDDQLHREDVVVQAGESTEVRCDFPAARTGQTLQVVLRSETGKRVVQTLPTARAVGTPGRAVAEFDGVRDDGASLYSFGNLADGEWNIELSRSPDLPPWTTTRQRVRADAGTVEFVCLDRDAPSPGYVWLQVVAAATDKPILGAGATTFVDGDQHRSTDTDAYGRCCVGPYLTGKPMQVLVRALDHAPALLDVVPGDGRPEQAQRVDLERGWGTMLVVREPGGADSGLPLADVQVVADGAFLGVTDRHGLFLLRTAARPRRIELVRSGYTIDYGSIDPKSGAPDGQTQRPFFVVMRKK